MRRIVVVLSDGADTTSSSTLAALVRHLRGAGVEVDAVGLESSPSFQAAPLREIASATGGELAPTRTLAGLEPIALQLSQARLATTYAVDCLPQSSARTLHVRVRGGSAGASGCAERLGRLAGFWSSYGDVLVIVLGVGAIGMLACVIATAAGARMPPLSSRLADYTAGGSAGAPANWSMSERNAPDRRSRRASSRSSRPSPAAPERAPGDRDRVEEDREVHRAARPAS